jgi:hypothetical protein
MAPVPSVQEVVHLVESETEDGQPLGRLRAASSVVQDLADVGDAALSYFVEQARHAGHSWSEIGEALGVSKQAAQQRQTIRLSPGLSAPTFERFTPRAHNAVSAAKEIARACGHQFVGTEHILLALYEDPEGLAARILTDSGFPAASARSAVEQRSERGPHPTEGKLSFSPRAKAVFSGALAAALEMGHNYIGTEHLLLGLDRGDGLAREVLQEAGLTPEVLRQRVTETLLRYIRRSGSLQTRATKSNSTSSSRKGTSPKKRANK